MRACHISSADICNEPELLAEYAEECSITALGKPDPQWQTYAQMESLGVLQGFGLFDDDQMVGFATLITAVLPHYGVLVSTVESLFVGKQHRGTLGSSLLLYEMEKFAARAGCKAILYSAPAGGQLEAVLGKRYTRTNSVFCKAIG